LLEWFLKGKDKLKSIIINLISALKNEEVHVDCLRHDDAGENCLLEETYIVQILGIEFGDGFDYNLRGKRINNKRSE
jgi:hypothetical protein